MLHRSESIPQIQPSYCLHFSLSRGVLQSGMKYALSNLKLHAHVPFGLSYEGNTVQKGDAGLWIQDSKVDNCEENFPMGTV